MSIVKREAESVTALASVISTAFAVYSRKNADKKRKAVDREAMISGRWSEGYSFVPFEPKELDRTFIKKTTSNIGILVEEEITNSWEGLLAYFQAPNIRFKIRHPLFLAVRFSEVLVIQRDALRFPEENENALRSFICSCGFPLNCKRDPAVKIGHGEFLPPWLIAFRSSAMNDANSATIQKLADLMKVVKGPALGFVPDDSLLPQRYSATFDVASLGQLYTKLYAIEFAGGVDGESGATGDGRSESVKNSEDGSGAAGIKRAKTKMEPLHVDGFVGFHPCGTPIFHPEGADAIERKEAEVEVVDVESTSASSHGPSKLMRSSFESYFIALHGELRMLLQKVVELVSQCVARQDTSDVENLRRAYADFTEALSVHAFVEEHVLFKKLSDRVPNVTESYSVDHLLERGRLDEISNIMRDVEPKKITDLFLKISELAAVHKIHMDKEEYHLLPYFLQNFDDSEISELIRQSQSTINQLSHKNGQNNAGNANNGRVSDGTGGVGMTSGVGAGNNGGNGVAVGGTVGVVSGISNGIAATGLGSGIEGGDAIFAMTGSSDGLLGGGPGSGAGAWRENGGSKISLLNPRHQNAIERAIQAAGISDGSDSADAPDNIDDPFFDQVGGEFQQEIVVGGNRTSGTADDVIALIEEMYK